MKMWQLLRTKKQWCQGDNAIDNKGRRVKFDDKGAVSWCMYGAIFRCYPTTVSEIIRQLSTSLNSKIWSWNDKSGRKFSEVKALLKKLDI